MLGTIIIFYQIKRLGRFFEVLGTQVGSVIIFHSVRAFSYQYVLSQLFPISVVIYNFRHFGSHLGPSLQNRPNTIIRAQSPRKLEEIHVIALSHALKISLFSLSGTRGKRRLPYFLTHTFIGEAKLSLNLSLNSSSYGKRIRIVYWGISKMTRRVKLQTGRIENLTPPGDQAPQKKIMKKKFFEH